MDLNASRVMSWLSAAYCGICLYFSNAASQSVSLSGGMAPRIGCHSVIERPLSVRRVAPPTTIIAKTRAATHHSQRATARLAPLSLEAEPIRFTARSADVMEVFLARLKTLDSLPAA